MQQLLAVSFVLLALWGTVWFLRKRGFAVGSAATRKQGRLIEQLDKMRMSPQHSIHLLRVEDRKILIAVHPHGVTLVEDGRNAWRDALARETALAREAGRP